MRTKSILDGASPEVRSKVKQAGRVLLMATATKDPARVRRLVRKADRQKRQAEERREHAAWDAEQRDIAYISGAISDVPRHVQRRVAGMIRQTVIV